MDHETKKYTNRDIEDGELSDSDDNYTPLQRPDKTILKNIADIPATFASMEEASEQEGTSPDQSSEDSDFDFKDRTKKNRIKPRYILNTTGPSTVIESNNNKKMKKNNIWSAGLEEECITENLKECGVDRSNLYHDRQSESYDHTLKYRLHDVSILKRRSSNMDDIQGRNQNIKRFRANKLSGKDNTGPYRKNVLNRLCRTSDDSSSIDGNMYAGKCILNLDISANSTNDDVAREIANKLFEEKNTLMLKVVNVLGKSLPLNIFKQTQKIENDGGMLINNGIRRRTPGGVFLFLLKNCDDINKDQKKLIFNDEVKKYNKDKKAAQAIKRDRKVEELKKTLKISKDLNILSTHGDLTTSILKDDENTNLTNPPPSPVTNDNHDNSSDFDTQTIQHFNKSFDKDCNNISDNKNVINDREQLHQQAINSSLTNYDDDFLDMHCDDIME